MRTLLADIRRHPKSALVFLAYWLVAWSLDAAVAFSRRGSIGGERTGALIILTCLIPPLFAAALGAAWRANARNTRSLPGMIGVGAVFGALVCEGNVAVIFCEDAGPSAILSAHERLNLFMGGVIFGIAGAILGLLAALTVSAMIRLAHLVRREESL